MGARQGDLIVGGHGEMPFGSVFHVGSRRLFITNLASEDVPKPTEVVLKEQRGNGIALWYDDDNLFPQKIIADIEKSNVIGPVMEWKAANLVGEGVAYGNLQEGPGGALVLKPMRDAVIDRWLERTWLDQYLFEAALDLFQFGNANAELQRNGLGEPIGIWSQDQSWLRLGSNNTRGLITKAYLCGDWETATGPKSDGVLAYEALDPYYDLTTQLADSKVHKHIIPLRLQTRGQKYYAVPSWNGVRTSDTLKLAQVINKMKLRLIEYLMQLRFWVEIDDEYWPSRFGKEKWKDSTMAQRQAMMNDEIREFEELMGGDDEAGKPKALSTRMVRQPGHKNDQVSMWKVHPFKLEVPTGAYVEDGIAVDHQLLRGLGVDPALYGATPGKNGASAGSGSADRVKRTNWLLTHRPHGRMLLRPLDAVAEVLNWNRDLNGGKPITFMLRSLHVATMDQQNAAMPEANIKNPKENGAVQDD